MGSRQEDGLRVCLEARMGIESGRQGINVSENCHFSFELLQIGKLFKSSTLALAARKISKGQNEGFG